MQLSEPRNAARWPQVSWRGLERAFHTAWHLTLSGLHADRGCITNTLAQPAVANALQDLAEFCESHASSLARLAAVRSWDPQTPRRNRQQHAEDFRKGIPIPQSSSSRRAASASRAIRLAKHSTMQGMTKRCDDTRTSDPTSFSACNASRRGAMWRISAGLEKLLGPECEDRRTRPNLREQEPKGQKALRKFRAPLRETSQPRTDKLGDPVALLLLVLPGHTLVLPHHPAPPIRCAVRGLDCSPAWA